MRFRIEIQTHVITDLDDDTFDAANDDVLDALLDMTGGCDAGPPSSL